MEQKKQWWLDQPFTISAVQCSIGDTDAYVLDEYVSKSNFTTEQLLHLVANNGHMGYYSEAEHGAKLDEYIKKSRQYGIREIVYNNTHCISDAIAADHPDWLQLTKDGGRMPAYSIYNLICVNAKGAWHKHFLEETAALCKHDIDGIFLDGPVMRDNGCYCETCKAEFEKKFGHSIYEATRIELQKMRVETVTQHVKEVYELVKSINPNIAVYLNNSALRADITGSNTRELFNYVDMIGAEGGFHTAGMGPTGLWHVSSRAKHLEGIVGDTLKGEKPIVCFFAGNQSGMAYYMHTPAETAITYAQSYANGSNIWYGVHFSASEFKDTESSKTATAMNKFVLDNKDVYAPSKTCARVALMWSHNTANNYAASVTDSDFVAARKTGYTDRGDHFAALTSVFDMLVRAHVQFDIIDEVSITNGTIFNYEAVILPEVACLSDEVAQIISEYVTTGGKILGNFDIGMYNEDGSFAGKSKLAEVFGFKGTPKIKRAGIGTAYMFKEKEHPFTDAISFFRTPAPTLNAEWEMAEDVNVLMRCSQTMPSTYAHIEEEGRFPSVTEHKFGDGCAYYVSGNFAETVMGRNILDFSKFVTSFCNIASRPTVISDDAGLYEVVLRRQADRFILHVINLTGAMSRPIDKIVPLHNVSFKLDLNGFGIDKNNYSIKSIRSAKVENVLKNGNEISFDLDKIDDYEVIVIE